MKPGLLLFKGRSWGPDTPRRVGRVSLECLGKGKGLGGDIVPKSVRLRASRTFQSMHPTFPRLICLYIPLARTFHIYSFFCFNECLTQTASSSMCDDGEGWIDGQASDPSCG